MQNYQSIDGDHSQNQLRAHKRPMHIKSSRFPLEIVPLGQHQLFPYPKHVFFTNFSVFDIFNIFCNHYLSFFYLRILITFSAYSFDLTIVVAGSSNSCIGSLKYVLVLIISTCKSRKTFINF
jgi:hypothetical protein